MFSLRPDFAVATISRVVAECKWLVHRDGAHRSRLKSNACCTVGRNINGSCTVMVHCAHDGGKLLPWIHCVYASLDATPPRMRPTCPGVSPGRPLQGRRKRPTATATATTLQLPLQRVRSGKEKPEHAKPTNGLSACPACSGGPPPPTLTAVGELRSAAQTHRRLSIARRPTFR